MALFGVAVRPAWPISAPRGVLVLLGAATLVSLLGIASLSPPGLRLRIDPSTEPLLPGGDPSREAYRQAVRDFGDDELYAVAIVCGEVFTPRCLDALDRAGAAIARLDGVRSVSSLTDVTSFRWDSQAQWIEIRPFIDDVPEDAATLAALRSRALADPVYRRTLVSDDARTAALNVRFRKMDDAAFLASGLDATIARILAEELPAGVPRHVAGRPHVKVHVYRGILRDLLVLVPIAAVVMAAVLLFFFRSARGVLLPLGTAVVANLWTFGAIGWLGEPLSLLTGLLAPMLLALGSVYGVHVLARYEEEARRAATPAAAALATVIHVRRPALVAGATTIIGFGALLITDVPAVFELGTFAMFGILSATGIALVGIPAALAVMPLPADAAGGSSGVARRLDAGLARLAAAVTRHSGVLGVAWGLAAAVAIAAIPRIVIDTDYLSYFVPEDPIRVDFEAVNRLLAGVVPLYVVVEGGGPGALREPALLEAIGRLQTRLDGLPRVSRTLSLLDPLRQLNRAFAADDPAAERIPDTRSGVAELLFMLPKSDLARFATVDHARANLVVRTGVVGSSSVAALADAIADEIAATPLPGARARVTGNAILLSRSADGIARGQPLSVGVAAIAIAVLVAAAMRSVPLGAIAMIPNAIPVLMFFGVLGLGAAPLSLPTSLIGCMALGVAIDDTVHLLARYRAERGAGASATEALHATVRRVGRPVVITSVMLCLGFLVITGSRFASLQAFGLLSALTMGVCLATDLILLPAVLARTER